MTYLFIGRKKNKTLTDGSYCDSVTHIEILTGAYRASQ